MAVATANDGWYEGVSFIYIRIDAFKQKAHQSRVTLYNISYSKTLVAVVQPSKSFEMYAPKKDQICFQI